MLSNGRPMVAIPGPSIIPEQVLAAMLRPMPNIYEGPLVDVSLSILDDLKKVARTTAEPFIAIGNGHAAWEMVITNSMSRGDKVLVLESGRFAIGWGEAAASHGVEVEVLLAPSKRSAVDPDAVADRLRADTGHTINAVLVVQTDTASSVRNDIPAIRRAIDSTGHPALFMVDCIASLGCEPYEMDEWKVDITVGASQKGLMCPPGIAFVWANDKALAAHQSAGLRNSYWDWTARLDRSAHYFIYAGTPPIPLLYAMREALDMILEEGLENVWIRHQILAEAVRDAITTWATPGGMEFNIIEAGQRSDAVTSILTGSIDVNLMRKIAEDNAGVTLGLGIGPELDGVGFRIGHMGHLNPPMILGTLGVIEAVLLSMNAPMGGSGVAAAAASLSKHFAVS